MPPRSFPSAAWMAGVKRMQGQPDEIHDNRIRGSRNAQLAHQLCRVAVVRPQESQDQHGSEKGEGGSHAARSGEAGAGC